MPNGFVHVLDDTSLDILLKTLDTASDFISYLEKKELFLTSDFPIGVTGEEELLAIYLQHTSEQGEHYFTWPDTGTQEFGAVTLAEGFWEEFSNSEQWKKSRVANRISYFWDGLIENFTAHFVANTLEYTTEPTFDGQERLLRFLASADRFDRRILAESWFDFLRRHNQPMLKASRIIKPRREGDPHYVFLQWPNVDDSSHEQYRNIRKEMLVHHCAFAKLEYPEADYIVGIATESPRKIAGSEDLAILDVRTWTANDQAQAMRARKYLTRLGAYGPRHNIVKSFQEYPAADRTRPFSIGAVSTKGSERNKICPCGSGRKRKKCCGSSG